MLCNNENCFVIDNIQKYIFFPIILIPHHFRITCAYFSRMMNKSTIVQYYCLLNYLSKQFFGREEVLTRLCVL